MELLRQKNVRLIAVNENVDSFREDDDFTPFRNIMNGMQEIPARRLNQPLRQKGNPASM